MKERVCLADRAHTDEYLAAVARAYEQFAAQVPDRADPRWQTFRAYHSLGHGELPDGHDANGAPLYACARCGARIGWVEIAE